MGLNVYDNEGFRHSVLKGIVPQRSLRMIERKITIFAHHPGYLVTGSPLSPCDLNGVLTYLMTQRVPRHIMKLVRVTLPQRQAVTICESSEQEWFILYPPPE
jgi:hypothetical protein